jgi:hypothetical protein
MTAKQAQKIRKEAEARLANAERMVAEGVAGAEAIVERTRETLALLDVAGF